MGKGARWHIPKHRSNKEDGSCGQQLREYGGDLLLKTSK